MAGRRLLDIAKLLAASKAVGKHHLQLRSQQLDVYTKTSTLGKAVKSQTDRVTLTVKAAIALSQRLNEDAPTYAKPSEHPAQTQDTRHIPNQDTLQSEQSKHKIREGLQQDHHYDISVDNASLDPPSSRELSIEQEKASRHALPDGTIPPSGAVLDGDSIESDTFSKRPEPEPVKSPLTQERANDEHHLTPAASSRSSIPLPEKPAGNSHEETVPDGINTAVFSSPRVATMLGGHSNALKIDYDEMRARWAARERLHDVKPDVREQLVDESPPPHSTSQEIKNDSTILREGIQNAQVSSELGSSEGTKQYQLRESRVPSSRLGRLWNYTGLATSMAFGAVGEGLRRATGGSDSAGGSLMLSPGNMERLVAKLSRMRGAALKLGQMISFQDSKMLPGPIHDVLLRVQDSADYMPASQRDKVLSSNLGSDWRKLFNSFDEVPIAAASIGQVHKATLAKNGQEVAVKVQYPGVASSINSDLNNLSILLTASRLLPKGLYLDKTIANAQTELAWECDYIREAECQTRFRSLLADETDIFTVPAVIQEASGKEVLTSELMHGVGVTKKRDSLSQSQRNWIGTQILRLCLREITEFKFMQTDPNWTNFLYNSSNQKIELLDFGASRDYPDEFVDPYVQVLKAAARDDRPAVGEYSLQLGYLTGQESKAMLEAHIQSVLTLGEPFSENAPDVYDFRDQTITDRVRGLIPVMVRERLAPPPEETYSLHRKLSGAFLLCARLGSQVRCKDLFTESIAKYDEATRTQM